MAHNRHKPTVRARIRRWESRTGKRVRVVFRPDGTVVVTNVRKERGYGEVVDASWVSFDGRDEKRGTPLSALGGTLEEAWEAFQARYVAQRLTGPKLAPHFSVADGTLEIRSGAMPATPGAESGTVLATITLPNPAFLPPPSHPNCQCAP